LPKRPRRSAAGEIAVLRRTLRTLDHSLRRLVPLLDAGLSSTTSSSRENIARRRPHLSARALAALKLQGRYMGYVRQLKREQKASIRKIRQAKGVRVAIVRARRMVRQQRMA
jgi:hypothetical protein